MIKNVFNSQVRRENFFIYLKKGRFILLILILISIAFISKSNYQYAGYIPVRPYQPLTIFLITIFDYVISIGLSLFLIPFYFKVNEFRKFWYRFIILFIFCVLGEFVILKLLQQNHIIESIDQGLWVEFFFCLSNQLNVILLISGILYFFELFEEIDLSKATQSNIKAIKESVRKLQGTQTDLPYLLQSLRGIHKKLSSSNTEQKKFIQADESILLFSEILRYKLYGYEEENVPLEEEIKIVKDLVRFYNSVISDKKYYCDIEIFGNIKAWSIEKQQLVKIIYPFLSNSEDPHFFNLLFFMEINNNNIELTIQSESEFSVILKQTIDIMVETLDSTKNLIHYSKHCEPIQCSFNICLKLQEKSNV